MLGSCFVENIGKKLEYFKFQNRLNPFGILFHPAAIHNFLKRVSQKAFFDEQDIFQHNGLWHSFEAHSDLNTTQKGQILEKLNSAVSETHEFIKEASHIILTPGTAWGYRLNSTGETVANCHKIPQKEFTKELMPVQEDLLGCVKFIRELNPSATVIFTVSPIRHLRDGFVENQRSKARLISAVHKIVDSEKNIAYFPSYEIMMDELRDYRFYAEDMLHPSPVAIDYIWEKFVQTWISSEARKVMNEIHTLQKGLSHRSFNPESEAHQKFQENLEKKIEKFQEEYPQIRF